MMNAGKWSTQLDSKTQIMPNIGWIKPCNETASTLICEEYLQNTYIQFIVSRGRKKKSIKMIHGRFSDYEICFICFFRRQTWVVDKQESFKHQIEHLF